MPGCVVTDEPAGMFTVCSLGGEGEGGGGGAAGGEWGGGGV